MLNCFNVLDKLKLDIEVQENPFSFELADLFKMGARQNPKRSFLFVSTLLGKHLEVHPQIPKIAGHLLANAFLKEYEGKYFSNVEALVNAVKSPTLMNEAIPELRKEHVLKEKTLFLGFAETATGLGQAMFSAFDNAFFVHTTREEFIDKESVFDFKEEHSHATDHLCYLSNTSMIEDVSQIVLIDDEITTGNTCLNLIKSLNCKFPGKRYTIVSLLDWRTKEHEEIFEEFQKENNIEIKNVSLLRGNIVYCNNYKFEGEITQVEFEKATDEYSKVSSLFRDRVYCSKQENCYEPMVLNTGRFGITSSGNVSMESECKIIGEKLKDIRKGRKTLVVGNGELIYLPSRIASYMGEGVCFKSSTRSPIHCEEYGDYPITDRIEYEISLNVKNFIYNLENRGYDEVMMFFEVMPNESLLSEIHSKLFSKGINHVSFVEI